MTGEPDKEGKPPSRSAAKNSHARLLDYNASVPIVIKSKSFVYLAPRLS
jgi:hypothetical protein